jgi:hypothetical protein
MSHQLPEAGNACGWQGEKPKKQAKRRPSVICLCRSIYYLVEMFLLTLILPIQCDSDNLQKIAKDTPLHTGAIAWGGAVDETDLALG